MEKTSLDEKDKVKICLTCSECGVRFEPDQIVVKVDRSQMFRPDIAYYCKDHKPKGVEYKSAKAITWHRKITEIKSVDREKKHRIVCGQCGQVFMSSRQRAKFCSMSCCSKWHAKHRKR